MAKPSGATQAKRSRERNRQEKQQEKRVERAIRKEQKKTSMEDGSMVGVDPDLIGIIPGPQPPQDY
jgi:hypothetical protein